jgi:LDH2 family malate/lactate/ureidoglycolate dehydrogenase
MAQESPAAMARKARVPVEVIERFMMDVFAALGVPPDDARICTDVLIASDLRGIESHGVGRLKYYYDRIKAGIQFPQTRLEIIKENETTALVDGHHGMGHVIAYRSMRMAMDKARAYGLGAVSARNSTHFGIAGYYSLMAAAEGMIGLTVTNARPSVAPTFGTAPMLGTNPIAFAAPSDMPFAFCFDAATPITQRGKIEVLARAEKPVPKGWLIDAEGRPETDPVKILQDLDKGQAAFLPLGGEGELYGGHKGYGLATMVEILSASLSGGAFLGDLLGIAPDGSRRPHMLGHFFLAMDIAHFLPLEVSRHITGQIMRQLQASRKEPGHDRIYVAGEKEYEREQRIRQEGITVNRNLRRDLQTMRDELHIPGYESWL